MAIDTSIYGNIRQPESPDLMGSMQKAMSLSQLSRQIRTQDKEEAENEAIKSAFAKNTSQSGELNRGGVLSDLSKISPAKMMQYHGQFKKMDADALEQKTKTLDFQINQLGTIGQIAMTAKDQPSYDAALKRASSMGLDVSQMPTQFDPGLVRTYAYNSLKQSERLAAHKQELESQLNSAKIGKEKAETEKIYSELGNGKTPNQAQFAAATFGTRAKQAEDVFGDLAKNGFDPTSAYNIAQSKFPGFLEGNKSNDVKRQDQAQRNFVNAILRRESGAAISESEFDSARKQYFPQLGDTADVLKQKEQNRKTAIAALNAEGAPALSRIANSMSGMNVGSSVPSKHEDSLAPQSGTANAATVLKHGTVEDGYVFMGGDPSNPKSWKRAR